MFRSGLTSCAWSLLLSLAFALTVASVSRAAIIVDGDVSDWELNVGDGNASTWYGAKTQSQTTKTLGSGLTINYMTEDTNDNWGPTGLLGPRYGGQDYDAEFLGVGTDNDRLVMLIVTGQRSDNGLANYSPGDIRINTSAGVFGIEVGGGVGSGSLPATYTEGALGATYNLKTDGHTKGYALSDGTTSNNGAYTTNAAQTAGSVWLNPTWIKDPISSSYEVQMGPGGVSKGLADYIYAPLYNQHAVIEVAVDYSLFGSGTTIYSVNWMPSCANDELTVTNLGVELDIQAVPEPSSLVLFATILASGGIGMITSRRRRQKTGGENS